MSSFILKIIACITMFIDHIGYIIYGQISWCNYIGRIAFPIFAYQITEGYTHTKSLNKYFFRLLVFAIISQIPFMLFHSIISNGFALNIFFTLALGLLAIFIFEKLPSKLISIPVIALLCIIAHITNMDYGYWGVLLIFIFYLCKNNKILLATSFFALLLVRYVPNLIRSNFYYGYIYFMICTFVSIIPILLYNKKQGRKIKYFLYFFYPSHLLLIYFLNLLFFN